MSNYTVYLQKSTNPNKKYMVTLVQPDKKNKTIHFGASGYSDYTKHKDPDRMKKYDSRHKSREKWGKSGIKTAGFWSKWILWSKPSLKQAIDYTSTKFNIKIIFDLEEEYGSQGFLSTLKKYKEAYRSDYMIIMDGPAHNSNQPTLTFGCRGIATCCITTYGSKLPQHSGHYGNYVSNPVFSLSRLLTSMKSDDGKVLIKDYYKGININKVVSNILNSVPDSTIDINNSLLIHKAESVGENYQEALQYPTLNVRQIGTSWKGEGLKTIIPEYATANIDVRLVVETDGKLQLEKIKKHIKNQGFLVLDRVPTDKERLENFKIVTFKGNSGVNAFRTPLNSPFGEKLRISLTSIFGKKPVSIRTMGGTVPIISAISELNIPAIIVPMVNMDNNQHNPNENIRIGNIRQGIKICLAILNTSL